MSSLLSFYERLVIGLAKNILCLARKRSVLAFMTGYLRSMKDVPIEGVYIQDHLVATRRNLRFRRDETFQQAYRAARKVYPHNIEWRASVICWAASVASKYEGDFVECGVSHGFMSTCVMHYLDWNNLTKPRNFYLLDTFSGIDLEVIDEREKEYAKKQNLNKRLVYDLNLEIIKSHFSQWHGVSIIQGTIPHTLSAVDTEKIAFVHLDLNCASPELMSLEYFWDKIVPGGVVVLDDYGWMGHELQQEMIDEFAAEHDVPVLLLPTGQGVIIKPVSP